MRAVGIQPLAARLGKTPPQWLLEGLFIVVSVALGFAVLDLYRKHLPTIRAAAGSGR